MKRFVIKDVEKTGNKLGEGSFGFIEELIISRKHYAGKSYNESSLYPTSVSVSTYSVIRRYAFECQLLSRINHPNIVDFIGIYFCQENIVPTLIMEFLPRNLESMINQTEETLLTVKLQILNEVARGLVFLHSNTPPLVHRDLTSFNVLLNEDASVVKISDFRNFAIVDPEKVNEAMHKNKVLLSYLPPEVTSDPSHFGPHVDIFSFGQLSLYTITSIFPGDLSSKTYSELKSQKIIVRSELERRRVYLDILKVVVENKALIIDVIERCLDDTPQSR